jgi:ubiquinone/menaquinone biosynthesis C-methylase UbiE
LFKFPIPEAFADLIDSPLRRRIQPPMETAVRHSIEPGMRVLDIGPGNGTCTLAAAQRVGPKGQVVAIDIEPEMVERVRRRIEAEGIENLEARVADVYDLRFEDGYFDVATMIAVIGEIPEPQRAMQKISRVLAPEGIMALSELVLDPDYTLVSTLIRWAKGRVFDLSAR